MAPPQYHAFKMVHNSEADEEGDAADAADAADAGDVGVPASRPRGGGCPLSPAPWPRPARVHVGRAARRGWFRADGSAWRIVRNKKRDLARAARRLAMKEER